MQAQTINGGHDSRNSPHHTLAEIAYQAMLEGGMSPDFSDALLKELAEINIPAVPLTCPKTTDLRDKLWVSIDNDDSKDLDQLTFAEKKTNGDYKIFIAVADVDGLVKPGTEIDKHASSNTTSVYTPAAIFSMLPQKLSTDLTSLNESCDRASIVVEIDVSQTGETTFVDLYPAWVNNKAKLAYNNVTAFLDNNGKLPEKSVDKDLLASQLILQDSIAMRLKNKRIAEGALTFANIELKPIIADGIAVGLRVDSQNRAQAIIEHFMIAANISAAKHLEKQGYPTLSRIVKTPKNWERIAQLASQKGATLPQEPNVMALRDFLIHQLEKNQSEFYDLSLSIIKLIGRGEYVIVNPNEPSPGHFDLALKDYCHSTAPNRRFPDLIVQRLLKSELSHTPIPYTTQELEKIAKNCTEKEDAAAKIERRLIKSAAAMVLSNKIGQQFDALVTGAADRGIWVRISNPPVEGKLVKMKKRVDVGDHITVRLFSVDIEKGFIDFIED